MPRPLLFALLLFSCLALAGSAQAPDDTVVIPLNARRILFLGDSITHAGEYIALLEAQLRLQGAAHIPEFINVGLASETCSGLTEKVHPFPRPDVHERLDRALAKVKPDVVVACYGMNDGIYHPFAEERFAAYQAGIHRLIEKVHASGAKIVLLTPPPFDAGTLRSKGVLRPATADDFGYTGMYEDYDRDVLQRYGEWLMTQTDKADMVVNIHRPITAFLAERRKSDPEFTTAPDGVHPNSEGHLAIAQAIASAWGITDWKDVPVDLLDLEKQRTTILHDAWLSDIGHLRPGIAPGLPVADAQAQAAEVEKQIVARVSSTKP